ncbi:tetratricopeptide repeat protein, partial [Thermotoga sp.]
VYYYRALSYYFKGDLSSSRALFEDFIKKFPNSEYADDAEYFLKRL